VLAVAVVVAKLILDLVLALVEQEAVVVAEMLEVVLLVL
jgi:hypothetical protein